MNEQMPLPGHSNLERGKYLQHCKDQALRVLKETQDPRQAWLTFFSDMRKNKETEQHSALDLGNQLALPSSLLTVDDMREFIEDFN